MYYPLTFAVFYQSIINPNSILSSDLVVNVLFSGKFNIEKNSLESIALRPFQDYIQGKQPICTDIIVRICNMQPEELIPRIKLLYLQDMSSVLMAVKNLLEVVDISEQFQSELQSKANEINSIELYLAKIFQLSLRSSNTMKELSHKDILFLKELGDEEYAWPEFGENELDKLLYKYKTANNQSKEFQGLKFYWQDIILPNDFDALMSFVAPIVMKPTLINLDIADIIQTCALDLDNKICVDGYIKLLEITCRNDLSSINQIFKQISMEKCQACLIMIAIGDPLISTIELVTSTVQEIIGQDTPLILGADCIAKGLELVKIQIIFRLKDREPMITSHVKREIQIPDFFKK